MLFFGALVMLVFSVMFLLGSSMANALYPPKPPLALWGPLPEHRFMQQIKKELVIHDLTLAGRKGTEMARNILEQHLKDENVKFGDPRFSWDETGAIELAHAYEIEYWDEY
jgi:hypothetical protein